MLADLLLPDAAGLHLERIETDDESIVLELRSTSSEAACPKCGQVSTRVHSKYLRHPRDLPWGTVPVRLRLHARRFRCLTGDCEQRIFVERFPTLAKPSARHTVRLEQVLAAVALALG